MKRIIVICTALFLSGTLYSQIKNDTLTIDDLYIDFTAPEITAFSILDLEVEEVVTPGSTKEFLTSVLNYVDDNGNAKPGLAIEWAPAHTFIKNVPVKGFGRSIRNLSISLATASSDTTSSQLGFGVKWTIYDGTNPYNNDKFREDLDKIFTDVDDQLGSLLKEVSPKIFKNKKALIELVIQQLNTRGNEISLDDASDIVDSDFKFNNVHIDELKSKFEENNVSLSAETLFNDRNIVFQESLLEKIVFTGNLRDTEKKDFVKNFIESKKVNSIIQNLVDNFIFATSFIPPQKLYSYRLEKLKEEFEKSNWNKPAVQVSGGWGWNSDSSFVGDYKQMVRSFAFTSGLPFDIGLKGGIPSWLKTNVRWLFQVKYQNYDNKRFELNDQWSIGNRIVFGRSKVRVSYEFAYLYEENESVEPSIDADGWRHTLGIQYKISEDFWTEVAFAGRTSETSSGLEMLPRFTFRRNFRTKPRE